MGYNRLLNVLSLSLGGVLVFMGSRSMRSRSNITDARESVLRCIDQSVVEALKEKPDHDFIRGNLCFLQGFFSAGSALTSSDRAAYLLHKSTNAIHAERIKDLQDDD